MRRMIYLRTMALLACFLTVNLFAQNTFQIKRGERPPIDFDNVAPDSYEPAKILIKVQPRVFETIGESKLERGELGYVTTGVRELDNLNRTYGVQQYKPVFSALYETNTRSSQHEERHKAWGFHLWYELMIEADADVIDAVRKFSALHDVLIAEPEYKKQLVIDDTGFKMKLAGDEPLETTSVKWAPNDPQYNSQWHYNNTGQQGGTPGADIGLQAAWEMEKGYDGVIVAIIDGGIQINHPDLAANMWSGIGYNFVTNSSTIQPHNHGAHVAGTVSAVNNNGLGVAGVAGGSGSGDGVRLMSCQVFTSTSSGGFHIAPVYAADNGAAISQNSWGYTQAGVYNSPVLDAIDYFNTHGGGASMTGGITIFAAGNSNTSGQWYPACYSGAFSVAATNNQDKKAWYSNFDTWIDVSAPGGETNSVTARGVLSTLTNNTYGYYQGTSMACPHVSGIAALIVSFASRNGLILSNAEVGNIIKNTTDDHYAGNPTFIGKLGTGRVNATSALFELQDLLSGVMNPIYISAQPYGPYQINLSWQKNLHNNDVILAWSYDGLFGEPQNGTAYNVSQTIPGGGTILYKGSESAFEHLDLSEATTYYYKIWSFNEFDEYSAGRSANATTECLLISDFPYLENFDASNEFPDCWIVVDHNGKGQMWEVGTFSFQVNGTTGNVAYINSDKYGSGNSQNTDLISPTFDLSGYSDAHLTFQHYFRQYQTNSTARLFYSIDNGLTWTLLQTWTVTTVNPATFNMAIPAVDGQPLVRFMWKYTGTWAYYWSIDDLEITGTLDAPSTYFTAEPTNALVGETIVFSELIGGTSFATWEWNFGDGADPPTALGPGPHEVIYYTNGCKTVSLTLDGVYNEIKTDYVSVNEQAIIYNEDFEPMPAFTNVPGGWDIMRNTSADGGLNGSNLVYATSNAWFINTLSNGLEPPEEYIKNGQASLAIDYTAPDFTWAISPEVQLPDDYTVQLSFWLWYAYNYNDGPKPTNFHVTVFSDSTWSILQSWVGQENNMYEELVTIDVTSFKNETVRFGFIYENTNGYPVAIDDIVISSEAPPFWVWLGNQCINWNNPENWSTGVPCDTSDVVILACELNPLISSNFELNNLTITSGAILRIAAGSQLTVQGEIINNNHGEGLIIESSTDNMIPDASLIHSTPGIKATVQRYIHGDPMDWHQLSSPVHAQQISGQGPGNFSDGNLLTWYEPLSTWVSYKNVHVWPTWDYANGGKTFVAGKGYLAAYNNNPVKEFKGDLNQGQIVFNLSRMAHPADNPGYNLIGNPYPSSIDWKAESGWDRNRLVSIGDPSGYAIWIWNPEQGQYGSYHSASLDDEGTNNVSRYIAPMQGFWVNTAENGSLTMNNQARVHSPQNWMKKKEITQQVLRLAVSNSANQYRDEVMLEFGHNNNTGGAEKLFSMKNTAPSLYVDKDNKKWSINFLNAIEENMEIAVGFKAGVSVMHTLFASIPDDFGLVLLEDLHTSTLHDLSYNPSYTFFANTGDNSNRFVIHFKQELLGVENTITSNNNGFHVNNNIIYITTESTRSFARVYDLQGRLLMENELNSAGLHQIGTSLPAGIYVIRIADNINISSGKFLIR